MKERRLPAPLQVIARALVDWWDGLVPLVVVSLAWGLSWLTIVLGPPATFGLYQVMNRVAHGESPNLGEFVSGARRYALQSWLWMLSNLFVGATVYANLVFSTGFEANLPPFRKVLVLFLGLMWLVVQFYALPFLMEQQQKSLRVAWRNGLFTVMAAPGYTLVVAGLAAFIAVISLLLLFPIIVAGPCFIAALGSRSVQERLETYGKAGRGAGGEPR